MHPEVGIRERKEEEKKGQAKSKTSQTDPYLHRRLLLCREDGYFLQSSLKKH